jgi:DNA polymerase/3'-5' exonuclease PolX
MVTASDKKLEVTTFLIALRQKAFAEDEPFKARAYTKAIKEIQSLPSLKTIEDVTDIPGIGAKIKLKIKEILETGSLEEAAAAAVEYSLESYNSLQEVYGIGPVKARDLIEKRKIMSINQLKEASEQDPDLLTNSQKVGLYYIDDLRERIPRKEMDKHAEYVRKHLPAFFDMIVVGSYRRGAPNSGDIDVMVTVKRDQDGKRLVVSQEEARLRFKEAVEGLETDEYIKATLARGVHKFMGVCRLPKYKKHRHIDILMCDPDEYWFTILYFTGSDLFNVSMRRYAIQQGYSLSEHGLKPLRSDVPSPPLMKSEKDIFDFLGLEYVRPEERNMPLPY